MTKKEARAFVNRTSDDDIIDPDDLVEAFSALYGRKPDQYDMDQGLWNLCCAEVL